MCILIAAETEYHQFSLLANCTNFTFNQLKMFNLAKGLSGAVYLIISISILVLLLYVLKAYKSTMQRLIIYHAVLTILHQLSSVLQLEHQFSYYGQSTVCGILGAFHMYITYVAFTSTAIIITYLLYLVLHLYFKGSLSHSKVVNCLVELLCILIPFIFPLFFFWTPSLHYGFGLGGYDCWIKLVAGMDRNCTVIYTDIVTMYSVSEAISLEILVSSAVVFVVYCRMRTSLRVQQKHIHTLIQKSCFLVSFHTVVFAVATVALSIKFCLLKNKLNQPFVFSVTILLPALYEVSLIILFFVSLRTSNSKICARSLQQEPRRRVNWDNDISSKDLQTRPPKLSFYTQPSYTVSQSMPYTGGFDSDEENNILILTSSADHPSGDYGAVPQLLQQIPVDH